MGMSPGQLDVVQLHVTDSVWRDKPAQPGRRPSESAASPAWYALFEAFAPLGHLVVPA